MNNALPVISEDAPKRKENSSKTNKTGAVPKRAALTELKNRDLKCITGATKDVAEKNKKEFPKSNFTAEKSRVNKRKKNSETTEREVQFLRRSMRLTTKAKSDLTTVPAIKVLKPTQQPKTKAAFSSAAITEAVRDIDVDDENVLVLTSTYVNDIYDYLFQLELVHPVHKHHLSKQKYITPAMRATLIDWLNGIHDGFHLVLETYFMTVGIIDLYLQKVEDTLREDFQLLGVACLFIAAKYEELFPPLLKEFVYMTDGYCQHGDILKMEICVLKTLDCQLSRPLAIHFLRRFAKAADIAADLYSASKYFLELATIEYALASTRPSETAAAALLLALHFWQRNPDKPSGFDTKLWSKTLEHYSHYTAKHLHLTVRKIANVARKAPNAKLESIYEKFKTQKYHAVSSLPRLYGALMDSIAEKV